MAHTSTLKFLSGVDGWAKAHDVLDEASKNVDECHSSGSWTSWVLPLALTSTNSLGFVHGCARWLSVKVGMIRVRMTCVRVVWQKEKKRDVGRPLVTGIRLL